MGEQHGELAAGFGNGQIARAPMAKIPGRDRDNFDVVLRLRIFNRAVAGAAINHDHFKRPVRFLL